MLLVWILLDSNPVCKIGLEKNKKDREGQTTPARPSAPSPFALGPPSGLARRELRASLPTCTAQSPPAQPRLLSSLLTLTMGLRLSAASPTFPSSPTRRRVRAGFSPPPFWKQTNLGILCLLAQTEPYKAPAMPRGIRLLPAAP